MFKTQCNIWILWTKINDVNAQQWRVYQSGSPWPLTYCTKRMTYFFKYPGCERLRAVHAQINSPLVSTVLKNTIKEYVINSQIKAYFPVNAIAPSVYTQRIVVFISTVSVIYFAVCPFYLQVRVFRCTSIISQSSIAIASCNKLYTKYNFCHIQILPTLDMSLNSKTS